MLAPTRGQSQLPEWHASPKLPPTPGFQLGAHPSQYATGLRAHSARPLPRSHSPRLPEQRASTRSKRQLPDSHVPITSQTAVRLPEKFHEVAASCCRLSSQLNFKRPQIPQIVRNSELQIFTAQVASLALAHSLGVSQDQACSVSGDRTPLQHKLPNPGLRPALPTSRARRPQRAQTSAGDSSASPRWCGCCFGLAPSLALRSMSSASSLSNSSHS